MTSEEMVKNLTEIIPMLEADGMTDDEIWEYCNGYIEFNKSSFLC